MAPVAVAVGMVWQREDRTKDFGMKEVGR